MVTETAVAVGLLPICSLWILRLHRTEVIIYAGNSSVYRMSVSCLFASFLFENTEKTNKPLHLPKSTKIEGLSVFSISQRNQTFRLHQFTMVSSDWGTQCCACKICIWVLKTRSRQSGGPSFLCWRWWPVAGSEFKVFLKKTQNLKYIQSSCASEPCFWVLNTTKPVLLCNYG